MAPEQRIMRIPLPVPLIREMDAVIVEGLGGYTTRAEFIVDAIQERVLELTIGGTEDAGAPPARPTRLEIAIPGEGSAGATTLSTATGIPMTALAAPPSGFTVQRDEDLSRPEGGSLFGLHNRDYPSLWALTKLAALTEAGPIPAETYYTQVICEAWEFGQLLLAIEKHTGTKRTALFPTNPEKRKAAEMGFRNFAIGDYRRGPDETFVTSGPLFKWGAAALTAGDGKEPLISVTAAGWALLEIVDGLSIEEPHPGTAAAQFLAYLLDQAPADHAGFIEIVRAIGPNGASRQEVLELLAKAWPTWSENEVSTNSAGYIARTREWGLVEPKQTKSKYNLTLAGIELVNGANR